MEPTSSASIKTPARPSVEAIALHRMGFGPRPRDVERVQRLGFEKYVQEQLRPTDADSDLCEAKLRDARFPIEYEHKGKKVKEDRPLRTLTATRDDLWKMIRQWDDFHYEERVRPAREVVVATVIRAVYSRWQLREVLVDFWHNHFNVNVGVDDEKCRILWPIYDRDVIRRHCFGNFREFLGATSKSVSMLTYLNNFRSKASPANENFARELFELHTLGQDAYLNHLYSKWREVPGATEGKPSGYIDQDVYEAARAFTGWTVADGEWSGRGEERLPHTGEFHTHEGWHDPYQKRILGVEFDPGQGALKDGERVLDLVAYHPATARHICRKLVRRLVSDDPPEDLVRRAARVWEAHAKNPDQIREVVATILLSAEFKQTWGRKVKRPLEAVAAFLRATEADVTVNWSLMWQMEILGQRLFQWPTPTGHPDTSDFWLSTNGWLHRWNLPGGLAWEGNHVAKIPEFEIPANAKTWDALVPVMSVRMLGYRLPDASERILATMLGDGDPRRAIPDDANVRREKARMCQLVIAMTPEFHAR